MHNLIGLGRNSRCPNCGEKINRWWVWDRVDEENKDSITLVHVDCCATWRQAKRNFVVLLILASAALWLTVQVAVNLWNK
jgi:hypothetical protein